jgi:hypothetical protein
MNRNGSELEAQAVLQSQSEIVLENCRRLEEARKVGPRR